MATLDDIHADIQELNDSLRLGLIAGESLFHAQIDANNCTGCGVCVETCPAIFQMEGEQAVVYTDPVPEEEQAACEEAVGACPVEAISIFTDNNYSAILSQINSNLAAIANALQ